MFKVLSVAVLGVALAAGFCPARPAFATDEGVLTLGAVAAPAAAPQFRATPPVPTPQEPGDGDTVFTTSPTMVVEASVVADSFHFRVMEEQSIAAQGYSLEPYWDPGKSGFLLQRGHRYHWSCRMRDTTGWSPWFAPDWKFVVGFNIAAPEPKLPEDGARLYTLRPVFVVKPVFGPVRYHFAVWDGKTLAGEGTSDSPGWLYDGQPLQQGNQYQWTCRIEMPGDTSGWFEPEWTFEVVRAPAEDGVADAVECEPAPVRVMPNPFSDRVAMSLGSSESTGRVRLQIFSTDGRMVRSMASGSRPARGSLFVWDGRDQDNRVVCPGTYFCRVLTESGQRVFKLTKTD